MAFDHSSGSAARCRRKRLLAILGLSAFVTGVAVADDRSQLILRPTSIPPQPPSAQQAGKLDAVRPLQSGEFRYGTPGAATVAATVSEGGPKVRTNRFVAPQPTLRPASPSEVGVANLAPAPTAAVKLVGEPPTLVPSQTRIIRPASQSDGWHASGSAAAQRPRVVAAAPPQPSAAQTDGSAAVKITGGIDSVPPTPAVAPAIRLGGSGFEGHISDELVEPPAPLVRTGDIGQAAPAETRPSPRDADAMERTAQIATPVDNLPTAIPDATATGKVDGTEAEVHTSGQGAAPRVVAAEPPKPELVPLKIRSGLSLTPVVEARSATAAEAPASSVEPEPSAAPAVAAPKLAKAEPKTAADEGWVAARPGADGPAKAATAPRRSSPPYPFVERGPVVVDAVSRSAAKLTSPGASPATPGPLRVAQRSGPNSGQPHSGQPHSGHPERSGEPSASKVALRQSPTSRQGHAAPHAPRSTPDVPRSAASDQAPLSPATGPTKTLTLNESDSQFVLLDAAGGRIEIEDRRICEAVAVAPDRLLVVGKQAGASRVAVWNPRGERVAQVIDVRVSAPHPTGSEEESVRQLDQLVGSAFPRADVEITRGDSGLIARGTAADEAEASAILRLVRRACLCPVRDELTVRAD